MKHIEKKIQRLRKGRCLAALLLMVLVAILLMGSGNSKGITNNENLSLSENRPMQAVVVDQGDSLWSLVQKHYDYKGDIRKAIYEVRQINNLKDAIIVPGQVLQIPQSSTSKAINHCQPSTSDNIDYVN
ncbi:MAG: LysM peptidoglycan-binding domain-containing protein [Clostridiales bacterium]|nr:LysM peptidoglycan-binding domain-containing protein [Clostridiales bacterium]